MFSTAQRRSLAPEHAVRAEASRAAHGSMISPSFCSTDGSARPQQPEERAVHQRVVAGIGRHEVQREALEDLAVGAPAAAPARRSRFARARASFFTIQSKRAELHRRQRIIDRRERLGASDLPPQLAAIDEPRRFGFAAEARRTARASARPRRSCASSRSDAGGAGRRRSTADALSREVLVVLDRGLQRVALEEHAALEVAEAVAGRARGVADERARLEQHAIAGRSTCASRSRRPRDRRSSRRRSRRAPSSAARREIMLPPHAKRISVAGWPAPRASRAA